MHDDVALKGGSGAHLYQLDGPAPDVDLNRPGEGRVGWPELDASELERVEPTERVAALGGGHGLGRVLVELEGGGR